MTGNTVWSKTGKCVSCQGQGAILGVSKPTIQPSLPPSQPLSLAPPFPSTGKKRGKHLHFMLYLNTLIMLRSLPINFQMQFNPWWTFFLKKSRVLSLKKRCFRPQKTFSWQKLAQEEVFRGLKQRFLSGKTQIFFKKSVHKGLNYICELFC